MATGDTKIIRATLEDIIATTEEPDTRKRARAALQLTYRDRYKPRRAEPSRGSANTELDKAVIREAYYELADRLGRVPSNREVGEEVGVDGGRVSEAFGSK